MTQKKFKCNDIDCRLKLSFSLDLCAVRISIVVRNEYEPVLPGNLYLEIAEDASIGAKVGNVTATDADSCKLKWLLNWFDLDSYPKDTVLRDHEW